MSVAVDSALGLPTLDANWNEVPPSAVAGGTSAWANIAWVRPFTTFHREGGDRVQAATSPVRQGQWSIRCEVRQGDVDNTPVTFTDRVQISAQTVPRLYFQHGQDLWTAISVYLPDPGYNTPQAGASSILYQTFPNTPALDGPGTRATMLLAVSASNRLRLGVEGGVWSGSAYAHASLLDLAAATKNVWHDVLIHSVLDKANGHVDVWHTTTGTLASTPTASDTGANIAVVSGETKVSYPQLNIYRTTRPETDFMFFGGFRAVPSRRIAVRLWD